MRICIVGPLTGRNPGNVTTQGEKLSDLFADAGHSVVEVSHAENRWVRFADIVWTLARSLRKIDLLIVTTYSAKAFVLCDLASAMGRAAGVPIIMSLHGGGLPAHLQRFPRWTRRVLARGPLVAQSEFHARAFRKIGFPVTVIPNVIDFERYPFRHRSAVRPRMFWMRAFEPEYDPEMAVRVLARVREEHSDASLVMAGRDKGLEAGTRKLADDLGLGSSVKFAGFLDHEGKLGACESSDIFLNTNRVDNRPVAVVEACAMGLPVVATAVGGIPDMLDHEQTALLVPEQDVDGMAAAVNRLVSNPELASHLSSNGRELAQASSPDLVLRGWERMFEQVVR